MMNMVKERVRSAVPLATRMRMAAWVAGQRWLPVGDHIAMGLVRDLLRDDPKTFHKFAWANHFMGYARWYDSEDELFDLDQMQPTRLEFFRDLTAVLQEQGVPPNEVRSVLEVGCSLGYLLRYMEARVFPDCQDIVGIDIDEPGIEKGKRFLVREDSRVSLIAGDMEQLEGLIGPRQFDVVFAAGVLSYLNEEDAARMVRQMLARTTKVLALVGLACADRNNNQLTRSEISPGHAGQWIHNFEALVKRAGGRVTQSRWEGGKQYNFQTICFVFAVPA
jgi:cyclopropane fatty-acyl-phospholipid synthase-like methyltransferase